MKWFIYMFLAVSVLSGCAGDQIKSGEGQGGDQEGGAQVGSIDDGDNQSGSVIVDGVQREVSYDRDAIYDDANVLSDRTIYFDFDSSAISADDEEVIKHHGKYLALNSSASMRIEGHTDERGSREYNIALADRRAQSVKKLLMFQGASSNQIVVISYGEEKPASLGHDESAWELNRRAEMMYGE